MKILPGRRVENFREAVDLAFRQSGPVQSLDVQGLALQIARFLRTVEYTTGKEGR